jgi:hypothetical protein
VADSYKIISFKGAQLPEQYHAMYFSKFLNTFKSGNSFFKRIEPKAYYTNYHPYIEGLLKRPDSIMNLAVLSDDEDVVLGWSLMGTECLHYIYLSPELRKKNTGITKALITRPFKAFTHLTHTGMKLWDDLCPNAIFNPFL